MFYIFLQLYLTSLQGKEYTYIFLPNLTNSQEPEPLGKKYQELEPQPEPLEKKSGAAKKFAGSPALLSTSVRYLTHIPLQDVVYVV